MKTQAPNPERSTPTQTEPLILADGHVHLHDCFPLDQVLDAALANFAKFGKPEQSTFQGALFLADMASQHPFAQLFQQADQANGYKVGNWTVYRTAEAISLTAVHDLGQEIFLFAGRQIITAEKLEVLALLTECTFADGMPLEATIQTILDASAIPVLPWGVGKWIGKRGKLLQALLQAPKFPLLYLGDNGGRPVFWLSSPYFKQAASQGFRILPGTDPLPLASESRRPGSFGFRMPGALSHHQPGQEMKSLLLADTTTPESFGALQTPLRFVRNQLAIRL